MTIDVEDYYQVEAFASTIDRKTWDQWPSRVERNIGHILDTFAETETKATFFTLGCIARRFPEMVRRIAADGHELASHGTDHRRADRQTQQAFRTDVRDSKRILEDLSGIDIVGYRAPTFSVGRDSTWAHDILAEEGYRYSSSVYPVVHDLYGSPDAPHFPFRPVAGLLEIPLTTVCLLGKQIPASGGGYFRLFPYALSRLLLRRAARRSTTPVFYFHPWELDPEQPRIREAPLRSRIRHYLNLKRTEPRLRRLLRAFNWTRMDWLFLAEDLQPYPIIPEWTHSLPLR